MIIMQVTANDVYDLRHEILRPNQPFEDIKYDTDALEGTFHIGAYDGKRLVSIVSFNQESHESFDSPNQYRLRAMATLPGYRKQGLGKRLVEYGIKKLNVKGTQLLWCKGRTSIQTYYEKIGFASYGDVFDYPGLGPHIIMYKELLNE